MGVIVAPIAQLAELLPLKEKVPGSSPGGGTRQQQRQRVLKRVLRRARFKTLWRCCVLFVCNHREHDDGHRGKAEADPLVDFQFLFIEKQP